MGWRASTRQTPSTAMSNPTRILIVDRDAVAANALAQLLIAQGYDTAIAASASDALRMLEQEQVSTSPQRTGIVIADQDSASQSSGIGLIRRLHDDWPGVVPIMVSGFRKVESAVQAMRLGAADYLLKPIVKAELLSAVERAQQRHYLLTGSEADDADDDLSDTDEPTNEPALKLCLMPADAQADGWTPMSLAEAMKEPERRILLAALEANGWNRQQTAAQLDINRTTLYKKIRQYRLDEPA